MPAAVPGPVVLALVPVLELVPALVLVPALALLPALLLVPLPGGKTLVAPCILYVVSPCP